jgi:hypothetical protein
VDTRQVVVDVVPRYPQLLEVAPHGLGRDPELAQRLDRRAGGPFRELLAVLAEDQPVVDVLRRLGSERFVELPVKRLVRPVVVAAIDVGDSEVDVVDDARQVIRGRAVLAQERRPAEALAPKQCSRLAVALLPLALTHRALVPRDLEPLEIAKDRFFSARNVACRIGVVDPEQQVFPFAPVDDRTEGVADMQRAGGAGREADLLHRANLAAARLGEPDGLTDARPGLPAIA